METTTQTPMKPVLIERISDDIKDLKYGDVANQQTLFSGRALQDLIKYDLLDFGNEVDRKYFTENDDLTSAAVHLVNLDLVTDAATRSFRANSYTNGPQGITAAGFVYVLRVLANGALTWVDTTHGNQNIDSDKDKTTYPREGNQVFSTGANPVVTGEDNDPGVKFLRQFFFQVGTGDEVDNESYTRTAVWNPTLNSGNGGWSWSDWTMVSGRKIRILVADQNAADVIAAPEDGSASRLARDVIYELHWPVGEIRLPDPLYYKPTTTISFEQYPDPDGLELRATKIVYSDPLTGEENCITAVPACDRNSANVDQVYDDGIGASMYTFEVVHLPASQATAATTVPTSADRCKTWELIVDAEETDYLAGMAEMLDMHTDRVLGDILQYDNRKYLVNDVPEVAGSTTTQSNTEDLTTIRAFTFCGYVKVKLNKVLNLLDNDWSLTVERIDAYAPSAYTKVDLDVETAPNPSQVYWVLKGPNQFILAENDGHPINSQGNPTWSVGVDYYIINTTSGSVTTNTIFSITGANLTTGATKEFYGFFYRNQLIRVTVHPGSSGHIHARDTAKIFCTVGFYPDPHDTYIQKIHLNKFAYTAVQLEKMRSAGEYPKDLGEDPDEFPVTSKALIDAYAYLASRLQAKGLLFGVIHKTGIVGQGSGVNSIDNMKSGGLYWIEIESLTGFPPGAHTSHGGHLVVIDSTRTSDDILHEEATQLPASSGNHRTITAQSAGTQLFFQIAGGVSFNVWTRHWSETASGTVWTPWIKIKFDKFYVDRTANSISTNITASEMQKYLLQGELCLKVGGIAATSIVNLPSPTLYPAGTCMQIELVGGSVTIKFAVGSATYEYTETWHGTSGDINLIKLETDGQMWYRIAVDSATITNITFDDDDE